MVFLAEAVYEKLALKAPDYKFLWDISDVLDDEDYQIWIDKWGHVTPEGNPLVAGEMLSILRSLQAMD